MNILQLLSEFSKSNAEEQKLRRELAVLELGRFEGSGREGISMTTEEVSKHDSFAREDTNSIADIQRMLRARRMPF